jgi:hypothetical protein
VRCYDGGSHRVIVRLLLLSRGVVVVGYPGVLATHTPSIEKERTSPHPSERGGARVGGAMGAWCQVGMSVSWGGCSWLGLGYSLSSRPSPSTRNGLPSRHGRCVGAISVALVILMVLIDCVLFVVVFIRARGCGVNCTYLVDIIIVGGG